MTKDKVREARRAASAPKVEFVDWSKKITLNGKPSTLANCPNCGYAPHQTLTNGKKICGFCGLEHS